MSTRKIGPWTVRSEKTIFENPWIGVIDHDVIRPDGVDGAYGVVTFKNLAIGVLPIDDDGHVWLVGQHRFPHDKYSWELPEGGGPLGAPPIDSAKRELAEETGYRAHYWAELSRFDISNSVTDERAICYLAWGLEPGEASPDPWEALELKRVSFTSLLDMVMNGEITDSLTIIMTMTAHIKALRGEIDAPISKWLRA